MKKISIILLLSLAVTLCLSKLPNPADKLRTVEFNLKDTFNHVTSYVRSGDHDKHKNHPDLITEGNKDAESNGLGHCGATLTPEPWKFMGFTAANMKDNTTKSPSWTNYCFQNNYASFQWLSDYSVKVTIYSDNPKYFGCSDTYSITDIYNFDLKVIDEKGPHEIIYNFSEQHGVDYVKKFGLSIIRLCDS